MTPSGKKLAMTRTQDKHFPMPSSEKGIVSPKINMISNTTMRTDGNNVDIDAEMAGLAKNNIYYNAAVRQIGDYFTSMKSVIAGQR